MGEVGPGPCACFLVGGTGACILVGGAGSCPSGGQDHVKQCVWGCPQRECSCILAGNVH